MGEENLVIGLELDVRGQLCPIPMAKVGMEIAKVRIGEAIRVTATDPACMHDIPAWARVSGNEMVSAEESDGEYFLVVKRLK